MPHPASRGVSLIGPMGAGKSTVGRILSQQLGRSFVDLDGLIEKRSGRKVADIIRQDGEERFRELEEQAVEEATRSRGAVLSCGGGVVVRPVNVARLRAHGLVAYLKVPGHIALSRINETDSRPLLDGDSVSALNQLTQTREHLYLDASDVVIDAEASIDEVLTQLLAALNE